MNILITAANSAEAHRLKNQLKTDTVILGDYQELPAFMLKSANMIKLPNPSSPSYTHEMLTLSLDKEVNTIYALRDEERKLLEESKQLFNEYGIEVVHGS
jgi:tRNA G37 N-methylase Trm5